MRLLLVHGRGQGQRTAEELLATWRAALAKGLTDAGLPALDPAVEVRLPFYGKRLDELTAKPGDGGAVARGAESGQADEFQGALVLELSHRAGVTDEEIVAELGPRAVARGPENLEWVQAAVRVLSRKVPWLGDRLLPTLTRDVHAYLARPSVTAAVDELVVADIGDGPVVVVGHSLGSIVAYRVLRQVVPEVEVPLLITVGCPLGIDVVQRHLPTPLGMPAGVRRWVNAADERDYVALYSRLDRDTFPADIEKISDVHTPKNNPHGIAGYLSDRSVLDRISRALSTT
jgi:hypothetical protein